MNAVTLEIIGCTIGIIGIVIGIRESIALKKATDRMIAERKRELAKKSG